MEETEEVRTLEGQGGRRKLGSKEARKQRSKEAGKQGSKEAGKQGGKEAKKQGSREARRQGSKEARKQGSREAGKRRAYDSPKQEQSYQQRGLSMIRSYKDLIVYQLAFSASMEIFWLTKKFPKEETYSLTDQLRRSSRSITANIVEGWAKREYENIFKKHLLDSIGSCDETKVWIEYAHQCTYLSDVQQIDLLNKYNELGAKLSLLWKNWKTPD